MHSKSALLYCTRKIRIFSRLVKLNSRWDVNTFHIKLSFGFRCEHIPSYLVTLGRRSTSWQQPWNYFPFLVWLQLTTPPLPNFNCEGRSFNLKMPMVRPRATFLALKPKNKKRNKNFLNVDSGIVVCHVISSNLDFSK